MKSALSIGLLNFALYITLVYNYRAVAQGRYLDSRISDILIAIMGFTMVKKIALANSLLEQAMYVLFGGLASITGIWITKQVFGQ